MDWIVFHYFYSALLLPQRLLVAFPAKLALQCCFQIFTEMRINFQVVSKLNSLYFKNHQNFVSGSAGNRPTLRLLLQSSCPAVADPDPENQWIQICLTQARSTRKKRETSRDWIGSWHFIGLFRDAGISGWFWALSGRFPDSATKCHNLKSDSVANFTKVTFSWVSLHIYNLDKMEILSITYI